CRSAKGWHSARTWRPRVFRRRWNRASSENPIAFIDVGRRCCGGALAAQHGISLEQAAAFDAGRVDPVRLRDLAALAISGQGIAIAEGVDGRGRDATV